MKFRNVTCLIVIISMVMACGQSTPDSESNNVSNNSKQVPTLQKAAEKPELQLDTKTAGEPDSYGRMPGDAHYGHDHPIRADEKQQPTVQTSPAGAVPAAVPAGQPTDGGPDKYGRMPGDAHYGHNHE